MYIIFGKDKADELSTKYTVLELDTIRVVPGGQTLTAYAIVDLVPFSEIPTLEYQKNLHNNLMIHYRKKDWNFCEQAIENLEGAFGKELDSFYIELKSRIDGYKENNPGDDWDPAIEKQVAES